MAWEVKKLGDVCDTGAGGTPLKSHKEYYEGGTIPWLRSGEVDKKEIISSELCITSLGLKKSSARLFPKNTVLIAMYGATAGQVGILRFEASTNQAVCGILPNEEFIPEFLYYKFSAGKADLIKQAVGGAQPNISQIKIKNTLVPVLSIPEQKRIVAILDKAFENISKAKENAEKNLNNANEIFESYLQSVFENKGEGWEERTIGEITEINPKKSEIKNMPLDKVVSFLPMEDLGVLQKQTIPVKTRKLSEVVGSYTYFAENDILLAKVTPCFENGKLGIARNLKNGIGFGSSEYIVFRSQSNLCSEYLFYLLSSNKFRNNGKKLMFGACGLKRLSKDYVQNTSILLPSLKKQQSIVKKLDNFSQKTKQLESIYEKKLTNLEELKKSILQKAFNGELIEVSA